MTKLEKRQNYVKHLLDNNVEIEQIFRCDLKERFNELLDECYPEYKLETGRGTVTFEASHVIKRVDELWYNEAFIDELDYKITEGLITPLLDKYGDIIYYNTQEIHFTPALGGEDEN